jgi:transcriptional regulator with XRE-family HTH domain
MTWNNIRAIRESKGIRLRDFAKRISIGHDYLGAVELGRRIPSIQLLEIIAEALDVEIRLVSTIKEPRIVKLTLSSIDHHYCLTIIGKPGITTPTLGAYQVTDYLLRPMGHKTFSSGDSIFSKSFSIADIATDEKVATKQFSEILTPYLAERSPRLFMDHLVSRLNECSKLIDSNVVYSEHRETDVV